MVPPFWVTSIRPSGRKARPQGEESDAFSVTVRVVPVWAGAAAGSPPPQPPHAESNAQARKEAGARLMVES